MEKSNFAKLLAVNLHEEHADEIKNGVQKYCTSNSVLQDHTTVSHVVLKLDVLNACNKTKTKSANKTGFYMLLTCYSSAIFFCS